MGGSIDLAAAGCRLESPMGTTEAKPPGPDLTVGIPADLLTDNQMLTGHVGEDVVLLARRGKELFAIGGSCTHYGGPLGEGLMVEDTVRCPWHHACFSLRTGEARHAPAFNSVACWLVEERDGRIFVRTKQATHKQPARATPARRLPDKIVIVGGGAAGFAAAERLRREAFQGSIVMLSADDAPPVDRPNLSKDYLAGNAPEDWVPLRPEDFYRENRIDLRLGAEAGAIDVRAHEVALKDGSRFSYDRLLLATGAEPVPLSVMGADLPHVHTLRSLADCRRIIARTKTARRAVVIGASFIGLEVAASLRAREIEVQVVAPEQRPMERILGAQMGNLVRKLHTDKGVIFHLGDTASAIDERRVTLKTGSTLDADLVVVGIGVRPRIELAEKAGLTIDRGGVVDDYPQTSAPDIFAAGDSARWPDPNSGANIRVEHWVVAERQGQTAALNMMGARERHRAVPFFWSQHYDVQINYVGHAEQWDDIVIEGDIEAMDCLVSYKRGGRVLAVASIHRDVDSLKAEVAMERAAA